MFLLAQNHGASHDFIKKYNLELQQNHSANNNNKSTESSSV